MTNNCINPINPNPDIAGIGVRINFYATVVLITLIPENEYTDELLDGIYKNSVIYGLSLIATAIVQTAQKQLDLYHAIVAMQILSSLNVIYVWYIYIFVQTVTFVVSTGWYLYVWIEDLDFGLQPSCNHLVKYVLPVLFFNVKATEIWLRILLIGVRIFTILLAICVRRWRHWQQHRTQVTQRLDTSPGVATAIEGPERLKASATESPVPQRQSNRKIKFMMAIRYVKELVLAGIGVATLEMIVRRNRSVIKQGENAWGFGQFIAIILTSGILIDVVVAVREWWTKKRTPSKELEGPKEPEGSKELEGSDSKV